MFCPRPTPGLLAGLLLSFLTPATAQDLIASGPDGALRRANAVDGNFEVLAQAGATLGGTAFVGGELYVTRSDGALLRYAAHDGLELVLHLPSDARALAADGARLLVAGSDGAIYRVDPLARRARVVHTVPGVSTLLAAHGTRLVGTEAGLVLREEAGALVPLVDLGAPLAALVAFEDELFAGCADGSLRQIDPLTGAQLASYALGAAVTGIAEHLTDLMVALDDGRVLRVDRETGLVFDELQGPAPGKVSLALDAAPVAGLAYCYGDDCPCSNEDPANGCGNSTGRGGYLLASGTTSVTEDDLRMVLTQLPPDQFAGLLLGSGWGWTSFGDGLLCIDAAQGVHRFPVGLTGSAGFLKLGPGLVAFTQDNFPASGQILAGDTWHFQAWYRDPSGPCGTSFNVTNAYSVTFTP